MRRFALWLSSGLGIGYMPFSSGTFGTLWGVLLFYLVRFVPWPWFALGTAAFILLAVYVSHLAEAGLGTHDSSIIVIDEVVGFLVAVVAIPFTLKTVILAFALFRLFDIAKPFPISAIDRKCGGGWGVVMDDVVAGIFANLSLRLILAIWGIL